MPDDLLYICEICGAELAEQHHCKAICPNCGRTFDCSDLPLIRANARIHEDNTLELAPGRDAADFLPPDASSGTPALPERQPDAEVSPPPTQLTPPPNCARHDSASRRVPEKECERRVEDLP